MGDLKINIKQKYRGLSLLLLHSLRNAYPKTFVITFIILLILLGVLSVLWWRWTPPPLEESEVPTETTTTNTEAIEAVPATTKPGRVQLDVDNNKLSDVITAVITAGTISNVIVSQTVRGRVSVHWHDWPWRKALNTLAKLYDLHITEDNDLMVVTTQTDFLTQQNKHEKWQQQQQEAAPLMQVLHPLQHVKAKALAQFIKRNRNALLGPRGHVDVNERSNALWLLTTQSHFKALQSLLQQWDQPLQQVLIKVRVMSVEKSFEKHLGLGLRTLHLTGSNSDNSGSDWLKSGALSAAGGIAWHVPWLHLGIEPLALQLNALQQQGRARVVASPTVITTNHHTAAISSGEEVPYQHAGVNGGSYVTFKKVLLALKVTPDINADGKVRLSLSLTQDRPGSRLVAGVPTIATRTLSTEVLLNNQDTVVIGGIDETGKAGFVSRIPGWGQVPVLGRLFRQRQQRQKHTELMLFVTPTILNSGVTSTATK